MTKFISLFASISFMLLLCSCQENTPDSAVVNGESTKAEKENTVTELDAATAEKMFWDFNANFQQQASQVVAQNADNDFVFINGEGAFVDKANMTELAKGVKITKWDISNLKIRTIGDVLVATGINDHILTGNEDGENMEYQTAFTYVYRVKDGELEIISLQHSHVQDEMDG